MTLDLSKTAISEWYLKIRKLELEWKQVREFKFGKLNWRGYSYKRCLDEFNKYILTGNLFADDTTK